MGSVDTSGYRCGVAARLKSTGFMEIGSTLSAHVLFTRQIQVFTVNYSDLHFQFTLGSSSLHTKLLVPWDLPNYPHFCPNYLVSTRFRIDFLYYAFYSVFN